MESAVEFINLHFTDENTLKNAKVLFDDVWTKYEADNQRLEQQLHFITTEAPKLMEKAEEEATEAANAVQRFQAGEDQLSGDVCNHLADVQPLVSKLSALTGEIKKLEKYSQYLQCLANVEDLSSDIQSALLINTTERAVRHFVVLVDVAQLMQESKCQHLQDYVKKTITFWYKILQDKLCSEFDEILRAWQWPFITTTVKTPTIPKVTELREQLGTVFHHLCCLQLPEDLLMEKIPCPFAAALPEGSAPFLLPIQMLLKPFHKRFLFHFCGTEKTNKLDKPEWYFTQILTWIRDHQDFLKSRIQPELEKAELGHISAVVELIRGLNVLAVNKLTNDMSEILINESIFAHLVDEMILFHHELHTVYNYPDSLPGCLHVLVQSEPFHKWILIEKKFALEKMDVMLSSPTRWNCQYKDILDVNDEKVSECGEAFMILLATITDRYRSLPSTSHQLQFVQLQLELLDDFRVRLLQVRSELQNNDNSPLTPQLCSILNTVNYIDGILQQWNNLPFFTKLQFCKHQTMKEKQMKKQMAVDDNEEFVEAASDIDSSPVSDYNTTLSSNHRQIEADVTETSLDELDVSLFDEIIQLFQLLSSNMLYDMVLYVFDDVKARSRPYRKEKWLAIPSQKDYVSLALSNSACEMLHILKDYLHQMESLLTRPLFNRFWQSLADRLDNFIYNQVILTNSFNEGGAVQLQFDMTRNLFPLFGAYSQKPENYFKHVKEACLVLSLSSGSALLMKDILHRALHESRLHHTAQITDPVSALHDIGVYKLALEDVELLLSLRIDLSL